MRERFAWIGWLMVAGVLLLVGVGWMLSAPTTASASQIFVTSTPPPPDPLEFESADDALLSRYALRLWRENDLIDVLVGQLERLAAGEDIPSVAVRMTQYELEQRFPGAPNNPAQRDRVLAALRSAPAGTIDMRFVARPALVDAMNTQVESGGVEASFMMDGFMVNTTPVDLNGDDNGDFYAMIRYPAQPADLSEIIYEDHVLLVGDDSGMVALPEGAELIPSAPLGGIVAVTDWRVDDLNGDGRDDLGVLIDRGDLNRELQIFSLRAGQVINLVQPGQRIVVGESVNASGSPALIEAAAYRMESERWNCLSTITEQWEWNANFFRPVLILNNNYEPTDTIGCAMLDAEPIFARTAERGIGIVDELLTGTADTQERGYDRASMALAMLYLLNDQPRSAREQVESLLPVISDDVWLSGQVETFVNNTAGETVTAVEVCSALLRQNPAGACDMDQVLTQVFIENPLVRDLDVVEQLENLGLPVLESLTLRQVGRLDRIAVSFSLGESSWWAFAPSDPNFYVPEIIDPPTGFEAAAFPAGLVVPPQAAYNALFLSRDPRAALTVLENEIRNNPGIPLSVEARYFEAFCFDMLANRSNARESYYALWQDAAGTHYGALARAHLELRDLG